MQTKQLQWKLTLPTMDITRTFVAHGFRKKKKKKKWNEIAAKLQKSVPKQKILDDIRNNVGAEFPCDDIIDKQDVVNIQRA